MNAPLVRIDICIGVPTVVCIDIHADMCVDMRVDMSVHVCVCVCRCVCRHVYGRVSTFVSWTYALALCADMWRLWVCEHVSRHVYRYPTLQVDTHVYAHV